MSIARRMLALLILQLRTARATACGCRQPSVRRWCVAHEPGRSPLHRARCAGARQNAFRLGIKLARPDGSLAMERTLASQ